MNLFRIVFPICFLYLLFSCKEPAPRPVLRIIPSPAEGYDLKGTFAITAATKVLINSKDEKLRFIAGVLTSHIEKYFGFANVIMQNESEVKQSIFLNLDENLKFGKEEYHLTVLPDGVVLEAATPNGLYYGVQTLLQLMPASPKQLTELILPAVEFKDYPRFAWRGVQLDVSRHFMPKSFILKFLDEMAMHKLNTLQWHLADDQGWRIEIKKYPRLTEVGSVRNKTIIGHIKNIAGIDTISQSGYYSQNDIREIVTYAAERFITIVPEIGMPGHSLAALASYPELGCTGVPYEVATRWGEFRDTFCPGKEETYTFINDVLNEMSALFPGKYFHIGGAECSGAVWEKCPECKLKMKNDSMNSVQELHHYFVGRVNKMLIPLGKESVGWDEIIKDTLLKVKVVVAWHGEAAAIESAKRNIQTVISPARYYNFDQFQTIPGKEPLAVGGLLTLEQVYNYEPVPATLSSHEAKSIIGLQANIWTPYMKTPEMVEYMTFPRAAALAEIAWSPKASRNYAWFKKRLLVHVKRYEAEGITYSKAEFKAITN